MYKRFDKTPREIAVRQLFWTLLAVSASALINFRFLPFWIPLLVVGMAAWRYWVFKYQYQLPNKWLRIGLSLLMFVLVAMSYRGINGIQAGTALLTLMAAIKLTETRGRRDCVVLLFISYFLIMATFLFDQSLLAATLALPVTLLITGALLRLSESPTPRSFHTTLINASKRLLQALPIMLVLFLLFPRIPGPFWSLPTPSGQGKTGLSDTMQPGSLSELIQSHEVAFRVKFAEGPIPSPAQRYWRGITLSEFDGRTWRAPRSLPLANVMPASDPVEYTLTLQPHERTWIFGLHMIDVESLPSQTWVDHTYQMHDQNPIHQVKQYQLRSYLNYKADPELPSSALKNNLALPEDLNPEAQALADQWMRQHPTQSRRIRQALNYFAEEDFYYSLQPPALTTLHSTDEFLFATRKGFCEHYSAAFVVLMRMMNIPARVVTGYQGGEINPLNQHITVRQSDAHAWAEVWRKGQGWVRVDPTQAVAPSRIESGIEQARPAGEPLPSLWLGDNVIIKSLRLGLDSVNHRWNEWVLGFEQASQMKILEKLGVKNPNLVKLGYVFVMAILFTVIAHYFYAHRTRRRKTDNALQATYQKLCRHLEKAGAKRRTHEGPQHFGERASRMFPDFKGSISRLMSGYAQYLYYPEQGHVDVNQWKKLAKAFLGQSLPPADADALADDGH